MNGNSADLVFFVRLYRASRREKRKKSRAHQIVMSQTFLWYMSLSRLEEALSAEEAAEFQLRTQ